MEEGNQDSSVMQDQESKCFKIVKWSSQEERGGLRNGLRFPALEITGALVRTLYIAVMEAVVSERE